MTFREYLKNHDIDFDKILDMSVGERTQIGVWQTSMSISHSMSDISIYIELWRFQ